MTNEKYLWGELRNEPAYNGQDPIHIITEEQSRRNKEALRALRRIVDMIPHSQSEARKKYADTIRKALEG